MMQSRPHFDSKCTMVDICEEEKSYFHTAGAEGVAGDLLWLPTRQSFCLENKQND